MLDGMWGRKNTETPRSVELLGWVAGAPRSSSIAYDITANAAMLRVNQTTPTERLKRLASANMSTFVKT